MVGPPVTPVLMLPRPSKVNLTAGTFHNAALPVATGGVQPYTYSFTCAGGALPSGMGFDPATRRFAGTPDAPFRDSCTYSVTDSSQPAATVSMAVEVEVASAATQPLALPRPSKVDLTVGTFHNEPLSVAAGGVQPYTYSFTCAGGALPSGMGFDPATRRFAGTPDAPFRDSCTYSVTDSSQPAATVSMAVEVEVASAATQPLALPRPSTVGLTAGTFHNAALPVATGGVQPYTYSFTCAGGALPSGMGFDPATRRFAGTPDAPFRDSCTYSVTDSSQPAATVSMAVEVEVASAATQPLALPRPSKVDLTVGTFHNEPLSVAAGGVQPYTYSFTCAGGALPSGMGFDPATRRFAGTPDAPFRDSCTYSVTDSSQPAATVSMAVEVEVASAATQPLALPAFVVEDNRVFLTMRQRARVEFEPAKGGVPPYSYEIVGCTLPDGLGFSSASGTLSGTPLETYRGPDCTYRVTDSASVSVSQDFELVVDPLDLGRWRFRTRTTDGSDHPLDRITGERQDFVILPHAVGGTGMATYKLLDIQYPHLMFDTKRRVLSYRHTGVDPILDTPTTFRYQVYDSENRVHDALCVDITFLDKRPFEHPDDLLDGVNARVRDDARWDQGEEEYRCLDTPPRAVPASAARRSNPIHTALAPVHARRAVDVAHAAVRDRVRGWSPGVPRVLSAITPAIGLAALSGRSQGFDYTGSSETLSTGAELGAGSWQAGLVASLTRTDLHYRAEAELAERGYHAGEHNTEVFSLHPFAAWHMPSGGHFWASMGAGMGQLSHRDDVGFPSWSRSDVRLRTHAVGAALPIADVLSGELEAEAGIESFALEIEGGGRISSTLPTMRGRDYHAGVAWSAPIVGAPSLSVAYKHLTGDGPEGGRLEAKGSVSVEGVFDPRLTVISNAEGSFGLGDHEHDSWGLGGGVRFASGEGGRGFAMNLDTRLVSPDDGGSSDVGIRGEAAYGLWSGPHFGTVRPYVGLIRYSSDGSVRRALGIDLHDKRALRVNVEIRDRPDDRFRALGFTLRHRF